MATQNRPGQSGQGSQGGQGQGGQNRPGQGGGSSGGTTGGSNPNQRQTGGWSNPQDQKKKNQWDQGQNPSDQK